MTYVNNYLPKNLTECLTRFQFYISKVVGKLKINTQKTIFLNIRLLLSTWKCKSFSHIRQNSMSIVFQLKNYNFQNVKWVFVNHMVLINLWIIHSNGLIILADYSHLFHLFHYCFFFLIFFRYFTIGTPMFSSNWAK